MPTWLLRANLVLGALVAAIGAMNLAIEGVRPGSAAACAAGIGMMLLARRDLRLAASDPRKR